LRFYLGLIAVTYNVVSILCLRCLREKIMEGMSAVAAWLKNGLEHVADVLRQAFHWLVSQIRGALEWIWGHLRGGFESLVNGLKSVFDMTAQSLARIGETLSQIPSLIMKGLEYIADVLRQAAEALINAIRLGIYFLGVGAKALISVLLAPPSMMACMMRDMMAELTRQLREAGSAGFEQGCKAWQEVRDQLLAPLIRWVQEAEGLIMVK